MALLHSWDLSAIPFLSGGYCSQEDPVSYGGVEIGLQKREGEEHHRAQKNGEDWSGLVEKPLGDKATKKMPGSSRVRAGAG